MSEPDDTATRSGPPPVPEAPQAPLARGTAVGRYLIVESIGAGGMGQVYAAVDPELGRRVAIKLVSAAAGGSLSDSDGQVRLMREAQAMARVSHPNVVAVYDVGFFGGGVFLAMELVDGRTLKGWLSERPRSQKEILRVFSDAGRGLAAAHEAGLVHRDFKPDNVLLDRADRVRVTDFGLARPPRQPGAVEGTAPPAPVQEDAAVGALLSMELTQGTSTPGTRAYMAPEQFENRQLDARTDQFAFCVTLYRALYGVAPFAGSGLALEMAVRRGKVLPGPPEARIPPWLRRILLRGLSLDPEGRFPSMEALLAELQKDPVAQRRRWLIGAGGVAVVALGAVVLVRSVRQDSQVCKGAERRLAGVWDAERRASVERAFLSSKKPYAADTARVVRQSLDARAAAWVAAHVEACEATRVRRDQTEEVMGLRMACLDDRLREMKALVALFVVPDDELLRKAAQAASGLESAKSCGEAAALGTHLLPPSDPAKRAETDALRAQLAGPRALSLAGKYRLAAEQMGPLTERARALGYLPLEAEALLLKGELQRESGEVAAAERTLLEALWAAEEGKHDEAAARTAIGLTSVVGVRLGRRGEGHDWARFAEAAVRRVGATDEVQGNLWSAVGNLYDSEGQYAEALKSYQRALTARLAAYGSDHFLVGFLYNNIGLTYSNQGRFDEAQQALLKALETQRRALGADHPALGAPLTNLGTLATQRGDFEVALARHQQARDLCLRSLGPEHPSMGIALGNLADTYLAMKRWQEAVDHGQQSLAIFEKRFPPGYPDTAYVLTTLGHAQLELGHRAEAVALLERSLKLVEANPLPPELSATTRFVLARALWEAPASHPRAHALALRAAEQAPHDATGEQLRAQAQAWLAAHPL